ncbi:MAG: ASCH domain-containing protein [Oscillospiraceae bacterium]
MKALSVRNPFAHFIFCGEKEFEFRTWKTDYRGDLLICSSAEPKIVNTISGHALCVVQLNEIFEVTKDNYRKFGLYKRELPDGKLYAWQLTNVRIIKPFPVKGKLNLFNVDDDLIEIIDDGSDHLSEEDAEKLFKEYIEPLLYKI